MKNKLHTLTLVLKILVVGATIASFTWLATYAYGIEGHHIRRVAPVILHWDPQPRGPLTMAALIERSLQEEKIHAKLNQRQLSPEAARAVVELFGQE